MPITEQEIERRFKYHDDHDPATIDRFERVRNSIRNAADCVAVHTPESREQSVALTKLEEACFWAIASLARPPVERE